MNLKKASLKRDMMKKKRRFLAVKDTTKRGRLMPLAMMIVQSNQTSREEE
jgi:hypothetical protein